jgi:hypothetical protein
MIENAFCKAGVCFGFRQRIRSPEFVVVRFVLTFRRIFIARRCLHPPTGLAFFGIAVINIFHRLAHNLSFIYCIRKCVNRESTREVCKYEYVCLVECQEHQIYWANPYVHL